MDFGGGVEGGLKGWIERVLVWGPTSFVGQAAS